MKIKACEKCGYAAATPFFDGYIPLPDLPNTDASRKEYGLPPKTDGSRGGLTICKACQDKAIAMRKPRNSSGGGYQPLEEKEIVRSTVQQETVQERAARQRRERQEEFRYTAEDEARWSRNRERVIAEREAEKLKILNEGVFVWVETQGTGHTLLTVHDSDITMFSYGRYDDIYPNTFSTQGEGVLIKASNKDCKSYLREQLFVKNAHVFKVTDVKVFEVFNYLDNIWNSSNEYPDSSLSGELTKEHGRVINSYNLFETNCTTTMVDALNKSGSKVFDHSVLGFNVNEAFTIPGSLSGYLERASKSFDMLVVDVTTEMKLFLDNPDSLKINQPSTRDVLYEVATSFGGTLGSSSGYDIGDNND